MRIRGSSLLVQRVEELIVLLDESTGEEIAFHVSYVPEVVMALAYLEEG